MEWNFVIASFWDSWFSEAAVQDFSLRFLSVLFEGLPFIFIGTLISGLIDVYLPSSLLDKLLPKNKFGSILTCGLLGLLIPVCECTVVPVIRRLVAKGLPVGSAFAYMLAAPIVNPITIASTFTAFNGSWEMALSRALLGYSVAVCVGVMILFLPLEKILKESLIAKLNFSGRDPEKKNHIEKEESECCNESHVHSHDEIMITNTNKKIR